jgi:hypothetical protein
VEKYDSLAAHHARPELSALLHGAGVGVGVAVGWGMMSSCPTWSWLFSRLFAAMMASTVVL